MCNEKSFFYNSLGHNYKLQKSPIYTTIKVQNRGLLFEYRQCFNKDDVPKFINLYSLLNSFHCNPTHNKCKDKHHTPFAHYMLSNLWYLSYHLCKPIH
jgi:hypothetical protein